MCRDRIYTSQVADLLAVVRQADAAVNGLFLVGHNPVLTELAEYLSGEVLGNVPTCGIVCIALPTKSWQEVGEGRGRMLFFDYPKRGRHGDDS